MANSSEPTTAQPLFSIGSLEVTPRRLWQALIAVAFIVTLSVFWQHLDIEDLHRRAQALPGFAVIAAISFLPLLGFPVSWLHLIAGVRFGFAGGMLIVAVTTAIQHLLGWALVRILPRRYFARIIPWRKKLAGAGHRDATLLCGLLPGMPYSVQLYLLPVIGVPVAMLVSLSTVIHTGRAIVTILLGDMSDDLTAGRIAILVTYYLILFGISFYALRHLRQVTTGKERSARPKPRKAH